MDLRLLSTILAGLIILTAAVILFLKREFVKECIQELRKVTWPTKDEALNSALITVSFIVIFSLVLFGIDNLLYLVVIGLVK